MKTYAKLDTINFSIYTQWKHQKSKGSNVSKHYTEDITTVAGPNKLVWKKTDPDFHAVQTVGNKPKGRISKRVFQENKVR